MREICVNPRALKTVVRNTRAEAVAKAQVTSFIRRGGFLPRKILVIERDTVRSDSHESE